MKNVKSIAFAGILVLTFTATTFAKTGIISATKTGVISATKTETNSVADTTGVNANVSAFQRALFELLLTLF